METMPVPPPVSLLATPFFPPLSKLFSQIFFSLFLSNRTEDEAKGGLWSSHIQNSHYILQTLVSSLSETVWRKRAGQDEWAWLALSAP